MVFAERSPNGIWPEAPSPGRRPNRRGKRAARKKLASQEHSQQQLESWAFMERILMLLLVSGVWIYSVVAVLQWLQFPFHRHQFAVGCITCMPLFIFGGLLVLIDTAFIQDGGAADVEVR